MHMLFQVEFLKNSAVMCIILQWQISLENEPFLGKEFTFCFIGQMPEPNTDVEDLSWLLDDVIYLKLRRE